MSVASPPSKRPDTAVARDLEYCIHPYTNLKAHQSVGSLVINRGEGVYVYDSAGQKYLEGMAGLWCAALGFSETRLIDAAVRAMKSLPTYHGFAGKSCPAMINLAERLIHIAHVPMSKVLFACSGSEANDTAIKLVWYYNNALGRPEKKKIISRTRAYHGVTVAAASLTGLAAMHLDFDVPMDGVLHTQCPHYWRDADEGESEADFASRLADNLERLIVSEGPDTVAAFFAEPLMGVGGVLVPPESYFEKVQSVLKRYDVLFVADEVICGFGRTGQMWGCQTFGIKPDIITCAKQLSSAYMPISAVLVSEPIWQAMVEQSAKIGTFGHGFTYGGHPVAAAVALEALDIYEERDIIGHVNTVGPTLQAGVRRFADHPLVGDARGIGLVAAVELVRDKPSKASFAPSDGIALYLQRRAEAYGLILRPLPNDVIAFSPPLIIEDNEINEMLNRFGRALDDTWSWARENDLV